MTFIISMMRQMCLLVAMVMMCSVSGRGIDSLRAAAETEPTIDDNTNNVRRQETTVCGRRQILTSKRDERKGGSNDDDQSDHLDKIIGGSDVTYGQVPWHVHIYVNGRRRCGGAIIGEFWILTTYACVYGAKLSSITLVVGDHRVSQHDQGERSYMAQRVFVQEVVNSTSFDIALIKVEPTNGSGISFNNYVQPICLPVAGESPADNDNLTISGWGDRPTMYTQSSDTLQTAVLPVFNHNQCINEYAPGIISDRIICVGRPHGGTIDPCVLDFGGPATYQSGDTHILAGIIRQSNFCHPPIYLTLLNNVLVRRARIIDLINQYSTARQRVLPPRAD